MRAIQLVSVLAALALLLPGCTRKGPVPEGPLTIQVTMNEAAGDDIGEGEPLPFSHETRTFTIDIEVIDVDGTRMEEFDGKVWMRIRPGRLTGVWSVEVDGGYAEGVPVETQAAFGPTRIWVEDSVREGASYATGVTPLIRFADPTIAEIQEPTGGDVSPLADNYVEVRTFDRELIVTFIAADGFGVVDLADPPGSYNAIYPFTFSRPRDVEVGDKLSSLSGMVNDYLSWTELSFPAFTVESSGHEVPEPSVLSTDDVCGGEEVLEAWESGLVRVENVVTAFENEEDCDDYLNYGQWPVRLTDGDCDGDDALLTVISTYTVPGLRFDCEDGIPPEMDFSYLGGMLRQIDAADPEWVLMVRGCEDIPPENRPDDCEEAEAAAKRHFSGPHPMPRPYDRREDRAWGVTYELD